MKQNEKCNRVQELFPLIWNRTADEDEKKLVAEHLRQCPECAGLFKTESPLFQVALETGNADAPLADHPPIPALDAYVRKPDSLDPDERVRLDDHLKACAACRETAEEIRNLPADAAMWLNEETAPVLTGLEGEQNTDTASSDESNRVARILRYPLVGYAAAAAILLLAIAEFAPDFDRPAPMIQYPTVAVNIPASARGAGDTLVFTSPAARAALDINYPVEPEPGHRYAATIRNIASGATVARYDSLISFDARGLTDITAVADTGIYEFVLRDIGEHDTVTVKRTFRILLTEEPQ